MQPGVGGIVVGIQELVPVQVCVTVVVIPGGLVDREVDCGGTTV